MYTCIVQTDENKQKPHCSVLSPADFERSHIKINETANPCIYILLGVQSTVHLVFDPHRLDG